MTLRGLIESDGPAGDIDAARLTVPMKPLRLVRVMLKAPEEPEIIMILVGFVVIEKSG